MLFLIVDDHPLVCSALEGMLRSVFEPCELIQAHSVAEALETVRQLEDIDLVLLDINMPIMDGITLLKEMRKSAVLANTPVIMLTGMEETEIALECLRAGACGYVTKPYNMDQIRQQISHCLSVQE